MLYTLETAEGMTTSINLDHLSFIGFYLEHNRGLAVLSTFSEPLNLNKEEHDKLKSQWDTYLRNKNASL